MFDEQVFALRLFQQMLTVDANILAKSVAAAINGHQRNSDRASRVFGLRLKAFCVRPQPHKSGFRERSQTRENASWGTAVFARRLNFSGQLVKDQTDGPLTANACSRWENRTFVLWRVCECGGVEFHSSIYSKYLSSLTRMFFTPEK